jgi:hypothetical protein
MESVKIGKVMFSLSTQNLEIWTVTSSNKIIDNTSQTEPIHSTPHSLSCYTHNPGTSAESLYSYTKVFLQKDNKLEIRNCGLLYKVSGVFSRKTVELSTDFPQIYLE